MAQWPPITRAGTTNLLNFLLKKLRQRNPYWFDQDTQFVVRTDTYKQAFTDGMLLKKGKTKYDGIVITVSTVGITVSLFRKYDNSDRINWLSSVERFSVMHSAFRQYKKGWEVEVEELLRKADEVLMGKPAEPATPPFAPACIRLLAQSNESAFPYDLVLQARDLERLTRMYYAQARGLQTDADLTALRNADDLITYEMLRRMATAMQPQPLPQDVPTSAYDLWSRNYVRIQAALGKFNGAITGDEMKRATVNLGAIDSFGRPISFRYRTTANHAFPDCFFAVINLSASGIDSEAIVEICPRTRTAEVISFSDGKTGESYYENLVETYDMYRATSRNRKVVVGDSQFSKGVFPGDALFENTLYQFYDFLNSSNAKTAIRRDAEMLFTYFFPEHAQPE